jgi:hypothetical protein
MIPRFFKDMPPKEERGKVGKWKIQVTAIFPVKENVVYEEIYEGKLWRAYVKVRLKAFLKDLATSGNYYGIGWGIGKAEEDSHAS